MEMPLGAWVTKCYACGTYYTLPRFPVTECVEGQVPVRPDEFEAQPLTCLCGQTFAVGRDSLDYVVLAVVVISRLSASEFQVEQQFAGKRTDLGPMTLTQLEAYLRNRTLVGVLPTQVIERLESQPEITVQVEVSVVRSVLAAKA